MGCVFVRVVKAGRCVVLRPVCGGKSDAPPGVRGRRVCGGGGASVVWGGACLCLGAGVLPAVVVARAGGNSARYERCVCFFSS